MSSQCEVDPYIQSEYNLGAIFLAMREILSDPADPDYDNPYLPESRITPYLEKLSAIYENPENSETIDSLFNEFKIKVNQEYNFPIGYKQIVFSVATDLPWVEDFKNTGVSGIPELDDLMMEYQFSLESFLDLSVCECTHFHIETDIAFLNLYALLDDFEAVEDIDIVEVSLEDAFEARTNYEGIPFLLNGWELEVADIQVQDNIYQFSVYSGDCLAGCMYQKSWYIEVSEDCNTVTLLSSPRYDVSNLEVYPNPAGNQLYIKGIPHSHNVSATIFSIQGQVIKTIQNISNGLSLSDIAAGVYFVKLEIENQSIIKKIIKQ